MPARLRQAVWCLGACQCVFWGVLYYGFSVALVPVERELGAPQLWIAGAFSSGLLVMALLAPTVGRALDRGRGAAVTRIGAALAVLGLLALSQITSTWQLLAAWVVLGLAMAALLYESAFALVIRAVPDPVQRLHALAAVTIFGGLASTVFLPVLGLVTAHAGWRTAQLASAIAVLLAAIAMERWVLPRLPQHASVAALPASPRASRRTRRFLVLVASFVTATISAMAVTTLLIPLMVERAVPDHLAALALAALGVAQLPGRLWMLHSGTQPSVRTLAAWPLLLQAFGLLGIAMSTSIVGAALAVALFGVGAGLNTIARPWLVQRLYGSPDAGFWNGQLARAQGFGRALGPVLAVALAMVSSASAVMVSLGLLLLLLAPAGAALLGDARPPAKTI